MTKQSLTPLAAYDIREGQTSPVSDPWPETTGSSDYRWIHLALDDPALPVWATNHLPPIAAQALRQSETRPRCERLQDGLILNLRGVNLNPESDPEDMVSLRMWITRDSIVSARIRKVWAVDAIRQTAEAGAAPSSVGRFLVDLTHGLISRIETVSLDLEERTDALEDTTIGSQGPSASEIGSLRQAVIKMRRFINPQREAIATLADLEDWIFTPDERAMMREISNRTRRIVEELDATRDRLSALQDHLDADRANALGRNSYILSVVAAIFLPLGFVTGLFGVNVAGMPGVAMASAFWLLTGACLVGGIALLLIFKFARWL